MYPMGQDPDKSFNVGATVARGVGEVVGAVRTGVSVAVGSTVGGFVAPRNGVIGVPVGANVLNGAGAITGVGVTVPGNDQSVADLT